MILFIILNINIIKNKVGIKFNNFIYKNNNYII